MPLAPVTLTGLAPAKVNLTLHVTGKRADGYHLLDSLVVFAGIGDEISATPAPEFTLDVSGQFSDGVPRDDTNSILRAARMFQARAGVHMAAHLRLTKTLPHAAGIGSGSSDAATTLSLLARLWDVPPLAADDPDVLALGADVPVCRRAPHPVRMEGIGERLSPLPGLPKCAMVLVNPRVSVPTGEVFRGLHRADNPPMPPVPPGLSFPKFCDWLRAQRNDLLAPAEAIAPEITRALALLRRLPAVQVAVMSGSGATCVGLVRDIGTAREVARVVQVAEMGWWVAPAEML
jgi:4-diphosphocytidyl-2-C-methyl-D-erythritol kinase